MHEVAAICRNVSFRTEGATCIQKIDLLISNEYEFGLIFDNFDILFAFLLSSQVLLADSQNQFKLVSKPTQ